MTSKTQTHKYKREHQRQPLVGPLARQARKLLFLGKPIRSVVRMTGLSTIEVEAESKILIAANAGPQSAGPYMLGQVGTIFGLTARRIRDLCDARQMGFRVGDNVRLIRKDEVISLLHEERRAGKPDEPKRPEPKKKPASRISRPYGIK